jgi:hypothetical protein
MALEGTKHVNGILNPEILGVVSAFHRGWDYTIFLVIGNGEEVGVNDTLENLNTNVFNSRLFAFH